MKDIKTSQFQHLKELNELSIVENSSLISQLATQGEIINYNSGEILVGQGEEFKGIYIVTDGVVKATKDLANKKDFFLWFAVPREILGLEAFFNDSAFSFTAVPVSRSVSVSFIPQKKFEEFLTNNQELKTELISILCHRINFTENRLTSILQKKTKERLVEILKFLSLKVKDQNSKGTKDSQVNQFALSDLANLIGTSSGYLKKILSQFQTQGLIKRNGEFVEIKNIAG